MKSLVFTAVVGALAVAASDATADAPGLPRPVITSATPQIVYPDTPNWLDANGRVWVKFDGQNLGPDLDGHPLDSGYVHILVRNVSPTNQAGSWSGCSVDGPCKFYGGTSMHEFNLAFDPGVYLGQRGSHLQLKVWISWTPSENTEPADAPQRHSDWSPIYTVDVAAPGMHPTVSAPPAGNAMHISSVAPAELVDAPKASWRLGLYGPNLCGPGLFAVFDGRISEPVTEPCQTVDDNGAPIKGGDRLRHVVVPSAARAVGEHTVQLKTSIGIGGAAKFSVKGLAVSKHATTPVDLRVAPAPANPTTPDTAPAKTPGQPSTTKAQKPDVPTPH